MTPGSHWLIRDLPSAEWQIQPPVVWAAYRAQPAALSSHWSVEKMMVCYLNDTHTTECGLETNRGAERLHTSDRNSPVLLWGNRPSCWEVCKTLQTMEDNCNWLKMGFVVVLKAWINLTWGFLFQTAPCTHSHTNVPEYAKAGTCAVGETTETKPLASLKVSQNKSKVLHGHSIPHSVQIGVMIEDV